MTEIANELNALAKEIGEETITMENTLKSISPEKTSKSNQLQMGFNYLNYNSKIYSFKRFYPLALEEYLTQEAKELHKSLTLAEEEYKKLLTGNSNIPQDLLDVLNKK